MIRDEFREHPPHSLDVPLGGETVIPCRPPRGKPDTRVRWMKDGDVVETSGRISVEDSGTLRIRDTEQEDIGVYVCVAYNVAGEKESIPCQLTVKGVNSFIFLYICASAECSVAGGILFLSCSSVCASVFASRNIVNTITCRVFDTFSPDLHQQCTTGQRWTPHILGSKGQRSGSHSGIQYAGKALLRSHNSSGQKHTKLTTWCQVVFILFLLSLRRR